MYTKEIRAQFKDELTNPGAFSSLRFDPLKHGTNPASFRSTAIYAATSLGMKVRTEFDGDELVCQRIDVPYPDSARKEFNATLMSDVEAATVLVDLLHPMPSDEQYDLKAALVRIAATSIMQHGLAVQRHFENMTAEKEVRHED